MGARYDPNETEVVTYEVRATPPLEKHTQRG